MLGSVKRVCSQRPLFSRFAYRNVHSIQQKTKSKIFKTSYDYFTFGSCENGQLGLGKEKQVVLSPKKIDFLCGLDVHKLLVGQNHSILILENGAAMSWGFNESGQLGQGHRNPCFEAQPIVGLDGHKVLDGACGPFQSFLVTQNLRTGKQAIWHAGVAYWDDNVESPFTTYTPTPRKVKKKTYLEKRKVRKIVAGPEHALFITEGENLLYSFGSSGSFGTLGHGFSGLTEDKQTIGGPTLIPSLKDIQILDIVSGFAHVLALTEKQEVYAWGSNLHGECGVDSGSKSVTIPRKISFFSDNNIRIKQLASGQTHSLALDEQGRVYSWGSHAEGKLGHDALTSDLLAPKQLDFFTGEHKVAQIACGTDHSLAITASGEVFLWGFGQHGALSFVTEFKNAWTPTKLIAPQLQSRAKTVADKNFNLKNYPFIAEELNHAIAEGDFFSDMFVFRVVEAQCGMDMTVLKVAAELRPEIEAAL